ncbi:hypothetical protein LPJ78_004978 [Coemansia sp. RSA 989]|nr:hypothetical protein LPJ78_004978 [Coemansia sp. RSA 989]KAJ1869925.1 hypothetical protein LPJ55_005020 [Coemansia sp. RSA 990]
MILGVGVDILNISRIGAVVKRGHLYTDRFARRILCASELEQFKQLANKQTEQTQYLATRWGVKEALYKAAYPHQHGSLSLLLKRIYQFHTTGDF